MAIARTEGVGALYAGVWLTWVKQAPQYAVTFLCYDLAKAWLAAENGNGNKNGHGLENDSSSENGAGAKSGGGAAAEHAAARAAGGSGSRGAPAAVAAGGRRPVPVPRR